jgi:hypothetical protein
MNAQADASPTTPTFNQAHEVIRQLDKFVRFGQHKPLRLQKIRIGRRSFPKVSLKKDICSETNSG